MVWGPKGETVHEVRPVTRAELEAELARHEWEGLREFLECVRDGDELRYESERNNYGGFARYVGHRKSGLAYYVLIGSFMS